MAWHPAGVNDAGITDLLVSREFFPLRYSVENVVERFMEYRRLDGSLPRAYQKLAATGEAFVLVAMSRFMARWLARS